MSTLGQGDFELVVRQQPKYACCGADAANTSTERKPIDPPPIVQLAVNTRKDPARTFLQNPYLILTARLIRKGDEDQEEPTGPKESDLTGTLVSSLYSLKDTDNTQGGFFVFGDLSVRRVGTYRLAFILYELRLAEKECWLLSRTVSDPFVVYATKTFPGLAESTFLTRSFSDQGVRLRLRKDSRTVSTKKRTISQTESIRAAQGAGIHGYLPHDGGGHDLGHNGHNGHAQAQSPHHLRRLSSLHDPSPIDRSRSYYSESPQMRAGEYASAAYGYAAYDDQKPHKRARLDGSSPDSPHPSLGGGAYDDGYHHSYASHHHHAHHPHPHGPHHAAGPRTVPDNTSALGSIYPLAGGISTTPTTATATLPMPLTSTTTASSTAAGLYASIPRLDTSHGHLQGNPHSPTVGGVTSAGGVGSVGGSSRRSPTSAGGYIPSSSPYHGGSAAAAAAAAMFAAGVSSSPTSYHGGVSMHGGGGGGGGGGGYGHAHGAHGVGHHGGHGGHAGAGLGLGVVGLDLEERS
ncbi:velvet factor-domain-containing protein [Dichotomopilus funicola]|uniref:Velvet factor-domain-containing protein n=1 Tax=Dichotomopilus funicola TaxID=1934379 RepID=A0AAN6VCJ2_9PEZI|nr:velvet factor-domain-containing protein [Dichotomopilus funicola]